MTVDKVNKMSAGLENLFHPQPISSPTSPLPQPVTAPISVFLPKTLIGSNLSEPNLSEPISLEDESKSKTPIKARTVSDDSYFGNDLDPILPDHEVGCLRWDRPNCPEPKSENQTYRRVGVINDKWSLFHAIAKGTSPVYQKSYLVRDSVDEHTLQTFEQATNDTIVFPNRLFNCPREESLSTCYHIKNHDEFNKWILKFRVCFAKLFRHDLKVKLECDDRMKPFICQIYGDQIEAETQNLIQFGMLPELAKNEAVKNLQFNLLCQSDDQWIPFLSQFLNLDIYLICDPDFSEDTHLFYNGASNRVSSGVLGPRKFRSTDQDRMKPERNSLVLSLLSPHHYELISQVEEIRDPDGKVGRQINPLLLPTDPLVKTLYRYLRC